MNDRKKALQILRKYENRPTGYDEDEIINAMIEFSETQYKFKNNGGLGDVRLSLLDQMATALTQILEHMAKSDYDKSLSIVLRCSEPLQAYKKFKSNNNEA